MHPVPCAHCGTLFMRPQLDPTALRLCHSCKSRHEQRYATQKESMDKDKISIFIKLPKEMHAKIEETCINEGIDLSKYFERLYKNENTMFSGSVAVEKVYSSEQEEAASSSHPEKDLQEDLAEELPRKAGRPAKNKKK